MANRWSLQRDEGGRVGIPETKNDIATERPLRTPGLCAPGTRLAFIRKLHEGNAVLSWMLCNRTIRIKHPYGMAIKSGGVGRQDAAGSHRQANLPACGVHRGNFEF